MVDSCKIKNAKVHTLVKNTDKSGKYNGTATATARIMYESSKPFPTSSGRYVLPDSAFLNNLVKSYNKEHKRVLGIGKRYPRVLWEHIDDNIDEVVGKLTSNLILSTDTINGESKMCVLCDILLIEPQIIELIEKGETTGVSVGLNFYENGKKVRLKELSITNDPFFKDAALLSSPKNIKNVKKDTPMYEILQELNSLQSKVEKHVEKVDLSRKKAYLNSLVRENKIMPCEIGVLLDKFKNIPLENIKTCYSTIIGDKFKKSTTFLSLDNKNC